MSSEIATTDRCPGTLLIARSKLSIAFSARPVWNGTSPIRTKNGTRF